MKASDPYYYVAFYTDQQGKDKIYNGVIRIDPIDEQIRERRTSTAKTVYDWIKYGAKVNRLSQEEFREWSLA